MQSLSRSFFNKGRIETNGGLDKWLGGIEQVGCEVGDDRVQYFWIFISNDLDIAGEKVVISTLCKLSQQNVWHL